MKSEKGILAQICEVEAEDIKVAAGRPVTPLLDGVRLPEDLRKLKPEQLQQLSDELRAETIDAVSVTGGQLESCEGRLGGSRPR